MDFLITCKIDFEEILARELAAYNVSFQERGEGWILARESTQALSTASETSLSDLCFAYHILENPACVNAPSVNGFAEKLADIFMEHIRSMRINDPWPFLFSSSGNEQLIHRAKTVSECWLEKIQKKMSRVAKLSNEGIPQGPQFAEGFFVHFTDFDKAFISFKALSQGQQRMSMDDEAPSRSFLKIEEAFHVFGREPKENDIVIDLGAAPGGWSYSALKRGAIVTAIDNGPLRDPVASHKKIRHLKVDALKYVHDQEKAVDWLLGDILENPGMILGRLRQWLSQKRCRYFVANLKVGRADPILLLKEIKDANKGILPYCTRLVVRHLYHDREEITLMGEAEENEAEVLRRKPKLEVKRN
jgi:23S rRNA (cytidine2498-2'-O)-methyltransferase